MSETQATIRERSRAIADEVISLRRLFHANPEMGFQETATAARICAFLSGRGIEHRAGVGRTGVLATIRGSAAGAGEGPAVLLRADMDALPIQEANDIPHRSSAPGVMHACGHDGHVAMLLGAADVLHGLRGRLRGTVRLAFQPAEEGLGGAEALIAGGALSDPECEAAFALHVWNRLPVGTVGLTEGPALAAADEFRLRLAGRGGHASEPMNTADPIVAAAHIVTALQTVVSRNLDALDAGVVTVSSVHGGTTFNVIPDTVEMRGTLRSLRPETRELLASRVREIAVAVGGAFSVRAEVEIIKGYPPTVNDPVLTRFARRVASDVAGPAAILAPEPVMGAEDFSLFLRRVPGAMIFLGSNNPARDLVHPHHSPRFDFDEACLPLGVELMSSLAERYLDERPRGAP